LSPGVGQVGRGGGLRLGTWWGDRTARAHV